MNSIEFYAFIVPLTLSFLILLVRGGGAEVKRRKQKAVELAQAAHALEQERAAAERAKRIAEARLPEGRVLVNQTGIRAQLVEKLVGYLMLVGIGTFGRNWLVRVLILLYLCGLERRVGSILLSEQDAGLRKEFPDLIPPAFHDRIVYAVCENYTIGMAHRAPPGGAWRN